MQSLPQSVEVYKRSPDFTFSTTPASLRAEHKTKQGSWGRIIVSSGSVEFNIPGDNAKYVLVPGMPGIIEPDVLHFVAPAEDAVFHIEFLRVADLTE